MLFKSMYILQSDNCLDLLTCTSLTYNVDCSCSQLCSWWSSVPPQLHTMENGTWLTLFQEQLTCLTCWNQGWPVRPLTHNPTPFIIQNHNCVHVEDTNWLSPVQCYGIKMMHGHGVEWTHIAIYWVQILMEPALRACSMRKELHEVLFRVRVRQYKPA